MRIGHFTLWITLLSGLVLSFLAFQLTLQLEDRSTQAQQKQLTQLAHDALEKELEIIQEILSGLRGLFLASTEVDRNEFKIYTRGYLEQHSTIQALEWIPRIERHERSQYEHEAHLDGLTDFRITEQQQGEIVAASERAEYFPVYYVEPLQDNEKVLGFDLASNPARLSSLKRSWQTRTPQATPSITLIQEPTNQKGFLIFMPVFKSLDGESKLEEERLSGFVLGVIRIGKLFETAIQPIAGELDQLEFEITDITNPRITEKLHSRLPTRKGSMQKGSDWRVSQPITIAGRTWSLTSKVTAEFVTDHHDLTPWIVLTTGIALTLLLAAYLRGTLRREMQVRKLVQSRTLELKASEQRFSSIVKNAVDSIITIDAKGHITLFNPAAEDMFGYSRDEVIGKNVKLLMPEPYHSEHDGYLAHHHKTGEKRIIGIGREVVGQRKDGSTFPIQLSVGEAVINTKTTYVGVITDISLQKETEKNLIDAKQEAENANRQKSAFLNVMSHELRTPLTVILGYLPMLKNREQLPSPDTIIQIAEDMDISGQHLLELINDLLDISKIEAGEMTLHQEQIQVQPLLDEMVRKFENQANRKGLKLFSECADFLFTADPRRLRQILINLIGNALKFTPQGEIKIHAVQGDRAVVFEVSDSGIGIPETAQPHIFKTFRQVDDSSTRAVGGSGLGLAITKRLVELHGGSIQVQSKPGSGAKFTFSIKQ